jgi:ABC-type glutathione transport system ATPase component
MMLGNMQAIEAGPLGGGREFNALVVKLRHRPFTGFDMVEKSDFHDSSLPGAACSRAGGNPAKSRFASRLLAFAGTTGWVVPEGILCHLPRPLSICRGSRIAMRAPLASAAPTRHVCGSMPTSPAIAVERLVKIYKQVSAVDSVSFAIAPGSITGLLGGNGAGKTTTIAMIMGLITPTSGSVKVLGAQMPAQRYRVLQRMNFESP